MCSPPRFLAVKFDFHRKTLVDPNDTRGVTTAHGYQRTLHSPPLISALWTRRGCKEVAGQCNNDEKPLSAPQRCRYRT